MKTFNSPKPKAGKAEIISFILLVLLSAAVFFVWQRDKNPGEIQKHSLITPEKKINSGNEIKVDTECVDEPEIVDAAPVVTHVKHNLKELKLPAAAITPPLPAYDIVLTESVVSAGAGEVIKTKSNSQIHIPANAFVDAQGKVVEGNVNVSYREYHDFHDIFLSGIPMVYEKEMLESAGMIEIRATQNNMPVYVNPENKIEVMLASASKETDYNLYYFDQKEMKWKLKGKDDVVITSQTLEQKPELSFLDTIETKFYFTSPKSPPVEIVCRSDMRDRKRHWFSRKNLSYVFDFSLEQTKKMPEELKALSGITWRYYGKDAPDVFMKLFGFDRIPLHALKVHTSTGYTYVTEDLDGGPVNYQIHFTIDGKIMSLPVTPLVRSKWGRNVFTRKWSKYYEAYAKVRYAEQKRFEKFQADTAAYYANNARYVVRNVSGETAVLRRFEVDNFGIWNCDHPVPDMPKSVMAKFTDEKGNPLQIATGYLVVKSRNTVYTVTDFGDFRFNPNAQTMFWAVLPDNKLAIIYPQEFAKHKNDQTRCTFTMKINDSALDNVSSLKSALSFN